MVDYMVALTLIQCGEAGRNEARRRDWTLKNSGETKNARIRRRLPWRLVQRDRR